MELEVKNQKMTLRSHSKLEAISITYHDNTFSLVATQSNVCQRLRLGVPFLTLFLPKTGYEKDLQWTKCDIVEKSGLQSKGSEFALPVSFS